MKNILRGVFISGCLVLEHLKIDELVGALKMPFSVIPAKAGIQRTQ
jgi:hypothetical protein